jgi:hypothetical protein
MIPQIGPGGKPLDIRGARFRWHAKRPSKRLSNTDQACDGAGCNVACMMANAIRIRCFWSSVK